MKLIFDIGGYVNKQNCRILGHRKPVGIHWKADALKTSHCLVRILVQKHNWAIFLRKWARRGRYSQGRSLSGNVERIFVLKNWRGGYWQHLVSTGHSFSSLRFYVGFSVCVCLSASSFTSLSAPNATFSLSIILSFGQVFLLCFFSV